MSIFLKKNVDDYMINVKLVVLIMLEVNKEILVFDGCKNSKWIMYIVFRFI